MRIFAPNKFTFNKYGIVLTDKRVVISKNGALLVNQPCCISRNKPMGKLAIHVAAYSHSIDNLLFPVRLGVVCDFEYARFMLSEYFKGSTRWFQRINTSINFAMRGCMADSEIRALKDLYGRGNHAYYIHEIMASVLGVEDAVIIYVGYNFVEIALITQSKINSLFFKDTIVDKLRQQFNVLLFDKYGIHVDELTLQSITGAFFKGVNVVLPKGMTLGVDAMSSTSFAWAKMIGDYISEFIKKENFEGEVYMISDYDDVNFLAKKLSSMCNVRIESVGNTLIQVANYLSLR